MWLKYARELQLVALTTRAVVLDGLPQLERTRSSVRRVPVRLFSATTASSLPSSPISSRTSVLHSSSTFAFRSTWSIRYRDIVLLRSPSRTIRCTRDACSEGQEHRRLAGGVATAHDHHGGFEPAGFRLDDRRGVVDALCPRNRDRRGYVEPPVAGAGGDHHGPGADLGVAVQSAPWCYPSAMLQIPCLDQSAAGSRAPNFSAWIICPLGQLPAGDPRRGSRGRSRCGTRYLPGRRWRSASMTRGCSGPSEAPYTAAARPAGPAPMTSQVADSTRRTGRVEAGEARPVPRCWDCAAPACRAR